VRRRIPVRKNGDLAVTRWYADWIATGGSAAGGSAAGGSAAGGSAKGGSAKGGSAKGGP
jgi:hypothetical protein